jgi:hypothetical protein
MDIFKDILVNILNGKYYDINKDLNKLKLELDIEILNKIYNVISKCQNDYKSIYTELIQIYEREKLYLGEYGKKRKYS